MEDITPNLISKVNKAFNKYYKTDRNVFQLIDRANKGLATYNDAYKYAVAVGNARAKAFKSELSSAVLPNGRMYYNIGSPLIHDSLSTNFQMVSDYSVATQKSLNRRNKIGLKPQKAKYDKEKVEGFINRLDSEPDFDAVSWILEEPVRLYTMAIVDDTMKANADFQSRAGIIATVIRIPAAGCCKWCDDLAGEYTYPGVADEVFMRHDNCRCTLEYNGSKMTGTSHSFNG